MYYMKRGRQSIHYISYRIAFCGPEFITFIKRLLFTKKSAFLYKQTITFSRKKIKYRSVNMRLFCAKVVFISYHEQILPSKIW
jgi:hypothetical protein